jgi:integration host factor subunit beta
MTKSELIARLAERYPQLVAKDADFAVKTILDAMSDALAAGQRIEIRGFGSFALNSRPPRIGRNPKSGDKVMVPEKRVPHFKPGKQLRERVDAMVGQPIIDDYVLALKLKRHPRMPFFFTYNFSNFVPHMIDGTASVCCLNKDAAP